MELLLWVLVMPATSMVDQRSFIGITEFFPGEAPTRAMSLPWAKLIYRTVHRHHLWPKGALASRTMHRHHLWPKKALAGNRNATVQKPMAIKNPSRCSSSPPLPLCQFSCSLGISFRSCLAESPIVPLPSLCQSIFLSCEFGALFPGPKPEIPKPKPTK